jgi:TonB family protein
MCRSATIFDPEGSMKLITMLLVAVSVLTQYGIFQDEKLAPSQDPLPTLVTRADPKYPDAALKAKIQGTVYIKALVDINGAVAKAEVIKSDAKELNAAALDAAKRFVFKAAVSNGKPVEVWVTIPFRFKLEEKGDVKK